ncbi:hypothetical protein [Ideonella sp.]|jgi:hypothetical protein|uniref:hypothetical protein n=1 Tax=Ideonella sp. TaxID=1929293 RepID=UPI0037BEBBAF
MVIWGLGLLLLTPLWIAFKRGSPSPGRVVPVLLDLRRKGLVGSELLLELPSSLQAMDGQWVKVPAHWVGQTIPRSPSFVPAEVCVANGTLLRLGRLAIAEEPRWQCLPAARHYGQCALAYLLTLVAMLALNWQELNVSYRLLVAPSSTWATTSMSDLAFRPPRAGEVLRIQDTLACDTEARLAAVLKEPAAPGSACLRLQSASQSSPWWLLLDQPLPALETAVATPDANPSGHSATVSFFALVQEVDQSLWGHPMLSLDTRVFPWFTTARRIRSLVVGFMAAAVLFYGVMAWVTYRRSR